MKLNLNVSELWWFKSFRLISWGILRKGKAVMLDDEKCWFHLCL